MLIEPQGPFHGNVWITDIRYLSALTDRRTDNLLRLTVVRERTGLSRTTIYRRMAAGKFPQSTPISDGLVAWYEGDINDWVAKPMGWRPAEAAA